MIGLSNAVMALALLSTGRKPCSQRQLAKELLDLKKSLGESFLERTRLGWNLNIRRDAAGYFSSSLDDFIASFDMTGELESKPWEAIKLNQAGIETCKEILNLACLNHPEEMVAIFRAWDLLGSTAAEKTERFVREQREEYYRFVLTLAEGIEFTTNPMKLEE